MVVWRPLGEGQGLVYRPRRQRLVADMLALAVLAAAAGALWSLETTGMVSTKGGQKAPAVGASRWVYRVAYAGLGLVGALATVLQVRRPWMAVSERGLRIGKRELPWSEPFRCRWGPTTPGRLIILLGQERLEFQVPAEARDGLRSALERRGKWEPGGVAGGRPLASPRPRDGGRLG